MSPQAQGRLKRGVDIWGLWGHSMSLGRVRCSVKKLSFVASGRWRYEASLPYPEASCVSFMNL